MKPSRKTITIPSLFTTSTRSWPAKAVALSLTWVFLVFLSCTDNAFQIGFRKDPRLGTRYVEIPLDYSVYLYEPILTQNVADDEISRLLVGRVTDPDLGELEATAIFNYSPPIEPVFPTSNAVFERLELVLSFDFYSYGATDSTDMQLTVHELDEQLTPERLYYSGTQISFNPTPVGDTTFALGPMELKNGWAAASDNDATNNLYYKQPIRLSNTLGQRLLGDLIDNRILIDDFVQFSAEYPGFALRMPVGNKILGINPVYDLPTPGGDDSRLVLTYKESGTVVTVDFPIYYASVNGTLNPVVGYTYLEPNRTGTAVDGLAPFADLVPSDGKIYAQSGTGLIPKFDLTKVYDYFDSIPFPVINAAELVLDNTFTGRTPEDFELLLLDTLNQYRDIYVDTVIDGTTTRVSDPYLLRIQTAISPYAVADETRVAALNEVTGSTVGVDQETGKVGLTIMTEFFQQIVDKRFSPLRARALALHPLDNEFKKTVSVLKLNASSAKVRIYYSKPLTGLP